MKENTYDRYKRVLEEIANGCDNPQERAEGALLIDRPEPTYKWKKEAEERKKAYERRKRARLEAGKGYYNEWLRTGHMPISKFARQYLMSRSTMERLLCKYERERLPRSEWRLDWFWRNRNHDRMSEIDDAKEELNDHGS